MTDISYYLNSHHIDICESMVPGWRPIAVSASGSKGTAEALGCSSGTEDTISLLVEWQKQEDPARTATGVYTASCVGNLSFAFPETYVSQAGRLRKKLVCIQISISIVSYRARLSRS